jgi:hypothetical protein
MILRQLSVAGQWASVVAMPRWMVVTAHYVHPSGSITQLGLAGALSYCKGTTAR